MTNKEWIDFLVHQFDVSRTKENYDGQIKNLQNKIAHYEELERRC